MRSRFGRLSAALVVLLGMMGTTAPPAHSTTVLVLEFAGVLNLSGPLGYSCTGPGGLPGGTGWTTDLTLCPISTTPTLVTDLPLSPVPDPLNFHVDWHHNTRAMAISSTTCIATAGNVVKAKKPPREAGVCSFGTIGFILPNTVSGSCDSFGGQVAMAVNVTDVTDATTIQTIIIDTHFMAVSRPDGGFVLAGHAIKPSSNQTGLLIGVGQFIPPQPTFTPGSCLGKTATTFALVGHVVLEVT